ncbi:MAG: class I SAM-dependent methyltransferase [Actinobacteria bacterium]|nr:class I SAM-dependent methyltransferase [Actinomycetota bacterium]
MRDVEEWLADNRALWDERVPAHAASRLYDLDGVVAGRDGLRPWEPTDVGPVDGRDLVHLQCHIGTDTVGWARRGARVVGLDVSAAALEVAGDLARRCGLAVEWVCAPVYDAVEALGAGRFDVVYMGIGALGWLPDLERWAGVVRDLLRPGGVLYLYEIHPMWVALGDDGRTLREHAIDAPFQSWDEGDGSYAAPEARFAHNRSWERLHTVGEVLTAVLDAGLAVELYREMAVTPAPAPWLERRDDGLFHFPDGALRFPLSYSLRARRPA